MEQSSQRRGRLTLRKKVDNAARHQGGGYQPPCFSPEAVLKSGAGKENRSTLQRGPPLVNTQKQPRSLHTEDIAVSDAQTEFHTGHAAETIPAVRGVAPGGRTGAAEGDDCSEGGDVSDDDIPQFDLFASFREVATPERTQPELTTPPSAVRASNELEATRAHGSSFAAPRSTQSRELGVARPTTAPSRGLEAATRCSDLEPRPRVHCPTSGVDRVGLLGMMPSKSSMNPPRFSPEAFGEGGGVPLRGLSPTPLASNATFTATTASPAGHRSRRALKGVLQIPHYVVSWVTVVSGVVSGVTVRFKGVL
ncbi:hypothetical protein CYMTET_17237 [Cymbomonas tetramitiformis]|uniref:Uncharacterized protein n=1 Tax=Cymbomonas tetramitiformis TaxID=36881 RepID=A0AAE0GAI2_9CHLO|nr:hypothetical protein CYMTET_17237 [Cymbomonas tetramitiformis]